MLTFGTSAFLKLVCLNDRPQRTELRNRLRASGGGYDYHRSLRLRAHRHLVSGESIEAIASSIDEIARLPERNSVRVGLERLGIWRAEHPGKVIAYDPVVYESPAGLFKVTYSPDFGIRLGDSGVDVHIWNTGTPLLIREMTYAALSLFEPIYLGGSNIPGDLAVLSLPDSRLDRLSEAGAYADVGPDMVSRVENTLREVRDELGLPEGEEHRPQPRV